MGFAIVTETMSPGAPVPFDFSAYCTDGNTIQHIVYGISQFTFQQYPNYWANDSNIVELGMGWQDAVISLEQTAGGIGYTSITLQAKITLNPSYKSGGYSSVLVTALAYIGNTSGVVLNNQTGITGIVPADQALGISGVPNVCAGILAGFSFTSPDTSAPLGFGVSAGAVLAPGNPPTKPSVLPMGSGICLVTNHNPMTTTVDVGSIILTDVPDIVTGTIVDCKSFNSTASDRTAASNVGHKVTSPTLPPLSWIAVFLQSFALQFQISSSVQPTPPFNSAVMGSSNANPNSTGFTFDSAENMYSCSISTSDAYLYYYAQSYTATYFYVGGVAAT
ncbi:MAG TPA: hypothetical protein DC054_00660 [Blastocatellia bacterium]|nr:hypothetical protein [Blastocatellia bacterium]